MPKLNIRIISVIAALFASLTSHAMPSSRLSPQDERFSVHTETASGFSIPYALFIPPGLTNEKNLPVILAFHGSGESGGDGMRQTTQGIGKALRKHPERFPAIVIMPQLAKGKIWHDPVDATQPNSPTFEALSLIILEQVMEEYSADRNRIYITGNSLGGFATWELAAEYPNRFAAAMPISGGGDPATLAPALKTMPIYAAHGRLDRDVKFEYSESMVNAVRATGNPDVRFKAFRFHFHNVWDATYGDEAVLQWLFAQHLSE